MGRVPDAYRKSVPTPESTAGFIFGSAKKMAVGIWIVEREVAIPFVVPEVKAGITEVSISDSSIHGFLQDFTKEEMLERLQEPKLRAQRYSRLDHPMWGVFVTAKSANEQMALENRHGSGI